MGAGRQAQPGRRRLLTTRGRPRSSTRSGGPALTLHPNGCPSQAPFLGSFLVSFLVSFLGVLLVSLLVSFLGVLPLFLPRCPSRVSFLGVLPGYLCLLLTVMP